ncbi:MAG: tryptophan synthase subunit alpha [Actinomycetota bacterium]|nr:tryptophan synthase subunit alpha [Actinomycetota bacterium]
MTGTERIAAAFEAARGDGRAALMPYLMGGFPDGATSRAVIDAYAGSGADLIELGVPFSDPLADGPVIHAAATEAIAAGATFDSVLSLGESIAERVPLIPMVYANMVLACGPERYASRLAKAGMAGTIVPDLPPEEAGDVRSALSARGLALIPLIAPTTPAARRAVICRDASGFVYVVSDTRTTGERDELPPELGELVRCVQADASVPAAVGFGIGTPEQAAEVGAVADGVIVGSRLVREVAEAPNADAAAAAVGDFISAARKAMSRSAVG